MKPFRSIFVAIIAVAAALSGAVFFGNTTAGVKATYYACADADTGALRRVPAEEGCLEGEERLVWSDGQPEPTPAPPSKVCAFEASGTWQEGRQEGFHNMFAIPGLACKPGWLGATVLETDYVLTVEPFPSLIRIGEKDEGRGQVGQGYGVSDSRSGCAGDFEDCAGLESTETPAFYIEDCSGLDTCTISFKGAGFWVRGHESQKLFLLLENEFKGSWSISGKIVLTKSP